MEELLNKSEDDDSWGGIEHVVAMAGYYQIGASCKIQGKLYRLMQPVAGKEIRLKIQDNHCELITYSNDNNKAERGQPADWRKVSLYGRK